MMNTALRRNGYAELSYYSPKLEYNTLTKTYYVYFQPFVLVILTAWLIALFRALWTDDYVKKFGFMTLYSCIDLIALSIQDGFYSYAFTLKNNYFEYDLCYVYEIGSQPVPNTLILFSQWLRVAQAFQRFIILYKPMAYTKIFNARSVAVFFVVIVLALGSLATMSILSITFERVVIIDRSLMKTVEICRTPGFFANDGITATNVNVESILRSVFQSVLPSILMYIFSIASILLIMKQMKFRKQFQLRSTATVIASERLVKVTIVTTISFAILNIPRIILENMNLTIERQLSFEYISIVSSALYVINIPVNFLLFSWLSERFRKTVKQIWKRLRKQHSSG